MDHRSVAKFVPASLLRHKLITVAAHGEKMPRLLRVVFQLLPQPAHVNVNGAGQHSGVIAPNLAQQFIARKHRNYLASGLRFVRFSKRQGGVRSTELNRTNSIKPDSSFMFCDSRMLAP